jgi:hypothetical protein
MLAFRVCSNGKKHNADRDLNIFSNLRIHATRRSPTVRARDFAVDEMGRLRASLGMGPTGPQLEIGGQSGRFRILFGMDKGIPS